MTMRSLPFLLITGFVLVLMAGEADAETEPVAHWSFDEGEGNIAHDESGNGNDGTLENGPVWVDGISGSALQFDGDDDYVRIGDSELYRGGSNLVLSLGLWFNIEGFNDGYDFVYMVTKFANSSSKDWGLLVENGTSSNTSNRFYFYSETTGEDYQCSYDEFDLTLGRWYHGAFVANDDTLSLYLDGHLVKTCDDISGHSASTSAPIEIAHDGYDPYRWSNISVDDLVIWNRALSSDEISDLYKTSRGPVAHWSFDEGEGNIAHDGSGNDNDGTLENGPVWVAGISYSGLDFDGEDDYVEVSDSDSLDIDEEITIGAWIKMNEMTDHHQVIVAKWYGGTESYVLEFRPNSKIIQMRLAGEYCISETETEIDIWNYVTGTYNGAVAKLFIDGSEIMSCDFSGSISVGDSPLAIGAHSYAGDRNPFNGKMDEVSIWNRALSSEEIADIYDSYNLSLPCQTGDIKLADDGFNQCVCAEGEWICTDVVCEECEICIDCGEDESLLPSISLISSIAAVAVIALRRRY